MYKMANMIDTRSIADRLDLIQRQLANITQQLRSPQPPTVLTEAIAAAAATQPTPAPAAKLYAAINQQLAAPATRPVLTQTLRQLGWQQRRYAAGNFWQPPATAAAPTQKQPTP